MDEEKETTESVCDLCLGTGVVTVGEFYEDEIERPCICTIDDTDEDDDSGDYDDELVDTDFDFTNRSYDPPTW